MFKAHAEAPQTRKRLHSGGGRRVVANRAERTAGIGKLVGVAVHTSGVTRTLWHSRSALMAEIAGLRTMRRDAMNKAGVLDKGRLRAAQTEPAQSQDTTQHNAPDRRTRPEESWQVYGKALSHSSLQYPRRNCRFTWRTRRSQRRYVKRAQLFAPAASGIWYTGTWSLLCVGQFRNSRPRRRQWSV